MSDRMLANPYCEYRGHTNLVVKILSYSYIPVVVTNLIPSGSRYDHAHVTLGCRARVLKISGGSFRDSLMRFVAASRIKNIQAIGALRAGYKYNDKSVESPSKPACSLLSLSLVLL